MSISVWGRGFFEKNPSPNRLLPVPFELCVFLLFLFYGHFRIFQPVPFWNCEMFLYNLFFYALLVAGYNPLTPNSVSRRLFFLTIVPEQLYCNGKVIFLYNILSPPTKQVGLGFRHLHFSEHKKLQCLQQDKSHT